MAAPKVQSMAAAASRAGLLRVGQVEERLAEKTRRVQEAFLDILGEPVRVKALEFIQKAQQAAERLWAGLERGDRNASPAAPMADVSYDDSDGWCQSARSREQDIDGGDSEENSRRLTAPHLQRELPKLRDCTRLRALEATLRRQSNWAQLEELRDARHKEVSHRWLWHLDSRRGTVMAQCDYILNVQRRLGARMLEREVLCRLCGGPLDAQLLHGECCDTAGATRGHYTVVRSVVNGLKLADAGVSTEARGLTTSQSRPADILTTAAVPGRSAALDVCVASPNAAAAAGDAAEAAFKRKLRRYRREIPQMAAAGILYRPLVWTTAGRPHPAVTRTLHYAAGLAASRSNTGADAKSLLSRWRHDIQTALLQRRAAMVRAVLPRLGARDAWLLTGFAGGVPDGAHRAPPVDGDLGPEEADGGSDGGDSVLCEDDIMEVDDAEAEEADETETARGSPEDAEVPRGEVAGGDVAM